MPVKSSSMVTKYLVLLPEMGKGPCTSLWKYSPGQVPLVVAGSKGSLVA